MNAFDNFRPRLSPESLAEAPALADDPGIPWPAPPVTPGIWVQPAPEAGRALLSRIAGSGLPALPPAVCRLRQQPSPFHADVLLLEVLVRPGVSRIYALGGDFTAQFDGASPVLHEINKHAPPLLAELDAVHAYLFYFGNVVCGDDGVFQVVARLEDVPPFDGGDTVRLILARGIEPPVPLALHDDGAQDVEATMLYSGCLFRVIFRISPAGLVDIVEDDVLAADLPIGRFTYIGGERQVRPAP